MSYTTHVTGEFTIDPPLAWREFKDSVFYEPNAPSRHGPDLLLRVSERTEDTPDGEMIRREATDLVMREIDEYNARDLMDHVQKAVDSSPGHSFIGYLHCEGEENTDIWRVTVQDGKAVRENAKMLFPQDLGQAYVEEWGRFRTKVLNEVWERLRDEGARKGEEYSMLDAMNLVYGMTKERPSWLGS